MAHPPSNLELSTWDPASRLVALVERIQPAWHRGGLSDLNQVERTLLASFTLDGEVNNGGFGAWLYHASPTLIQITPHCLSQLPDPHGFVLRIVECIIHDIDASRLALEWELWNNYLDSCDNWFWQRIEAYDLAFGAVESSFVEILWDYAAKHLEQVRSH